MPGLIIHRSDGEVTGTWSVSEELPSRGGNDAAVVLCHDVRDHRDMRAIVKNDALLTVVDVNVIGDDVFTDHKAIFEALHRHTADDVVIVLVA